MNVMKTTFELRKVKVSASLLQRLRALETRQAVATAVLAALLVWPCFLFSADAPMAAVVPVPTTIERGPDHRVVQTIREVVVGERTNRVTEKYTELATGMHYQNERGDYVESREAIEIVNGFGVASQGHHRAIWSPS